MKTNLKRELFNDVVTGLMVAATFAAVMPADAWADLLNTANNTRANILNPIVQIATYVSYGLGTVLVIAGISDAKKHSENASSNPLSKALGKLGAGGAFLVAPFVMGMLQSTSNTTLGGGAATTIAPVQF